MPPFDMTSHSLHLGDARDLSWIADESAELVVTSPPYWTVKQYAEDRDGQMGDIAGRNSIGNEIELAHINIAYRKLQQLSSQARLR